MPAYSLRTASADLEPRPCHRGVVPTATFCARLYCLPELGGLALYPETRIALYPTGRLYLYCFSPEIPFPSSPPGSQASKQLHSGARIHRQLRCQVWLPRCRWGELYAPGAALSTPYGHTPPIHRHAAASRTRARGNHRSITRRGSGRAGAIRNSLRTASHSHLTVFDNALYRETI